ncbi:MAG TPA: hypothetical protein VFP45_00280 [Candidatus Nitrosotalea sp.]|nr:hypothetical protein [Candidatus Nitrosotalea sp.]
MKRSYAVLIGGFVLFVAGNFFGNSILNLIVTDNPSHSSLVTDTNYHLIWWSNSLLLLGKMGIIILVIGVFVFFTDRKSTRKTNQI